MRRPALETLIVLLMLSGCGEAVENSVASFEAQTELNLCPDALVRGANDTRVGFDRLYSAEVRMSDRCERGLRQELLNRAQEKPACAWSPECNFWMGGDLNVFLSRQGEWLAIQVAG